MVEAKYPSLRTLATICLVMPVTTASVERSISQMKLIKSRLRNRLSDKSPIYMQRLTRIEIQIKLIRIRVNVITQV